MKCDDVCDQLLTADAVPAEVREHAAACEDCRATAEILGILSVEGDDRRQPDLRPEVQAAIRQAAAAAIRPFPVRLLWAAAAVLAIAVIIGWAG